MFRRWVVPVGLGVLALVHREQLLRHGGVFGIDPLALIFVGVLDLKTFFKTEGLVERGAEITYLPVITQPIDMVATHFEKALVKATLTEIQRGAESADKGEQPAATQERR